MRGRQLGDPVDGKLAYAGVVDLDLVQGWLDPTSNSGVQDGWIR